MPQQPAAPQHVQRQPGQPGAPQPPGMGKRSRKRAAAAAEAARVELNAANGKIESLAKDLAEARRLIEKLSQPSPKSQPKEEKKKGGLLSRFKKAAKKVVKMQRFPWSRDILGEASHADEVDHDLLMKLLMGGGKKRGRS